MRTYTTKQKMKTVYEPKVFCDDCGKECSNCNIEFKFQFSFCDDAEHFKDVCYDCYETKYKKEWSERRQKDFEEMLRIYKEEKEAKKE